MRSLTTERLTLEPLARAHAPEMFAVLSSPTIYRFIDDRPPISVAELAVRYARLEARRSPGGEEQWLNWIVRETSSRGALGYVQATVGAEQTSIGYVIAPSSHRRGFGREATAAMVRELGESYGVRRVVATVDRRNAASIALLRALGFQLRHAPTAEEQLFGLDT